MRSAPLLLLVAGLPSAASAQSDSGTANLLVGGTVPVACAVGAPAAVAGRQLNFRGLNGSALQIDRLVDPVTLSTAAASIELRFESVCNLSHRLRVETQNNGLWQTVERGDTGADGFATAIPYRARLSWADRDLALNADAVSRRIAETSMLVDGAAVGDIRLRLDMWRITVAPHQ
jgi:hypothetical protein